MGGVTYSWDNNELLICYSFVTRYTCESIIGDLAGIRALQYSTAREAEKSIPRGSSLAYIGVVLAIFNRCTWVFGEESDNVIFGLAHGPHGLPVARCEGE